MTSARCRHSVALIAILCLAAFLRTWRLGASEFKFDEARVCALAADFVDSGRPPVRGMGSSVGIDNPPLTIYLMSLPVLFSRDPLVATGFVALLNVAAVGGCYWLGRRYWGMGVGLLAALLLAVSPWAVYYSRKVWAQDLLLPGVIGFFACLLAWTLEGRRWALSGAIVILAALTQIHLAALAFVPLLAAVVGIAIAAGLLGDRGNLRRLWLPLLVGVAGAALLYAPYLAFDAANGWRNAHTFLQVMATPGQTRWQALRFALLNIGGREIHALAGPQRFQDYLRGIVDLRYWPDRIEEGLAAISAVYLLLRWLAAAGWALRPQVRDPGSAASGAGRDESGVAAFRHRLKRDGLLLLWLIAPVSFYLRAKSEVYPHYLIPLYPAPYLALALFLLDVLRPLSRLRGWRRPVHSLSALALAVLVAWQSYLALSVYAFVATHYTPGGVGTPIAIYRQVMRTAETYAARWDNRQVVLLCPGDDPRYDECPAVFDFMAARSLDLRLADANASLLFPQGDADVLAVLAPGESAAAVELPRFAQGLPESVSLREGAGAYRFYRLSAGDAPQAPVQPPGVPVHLANGASLLGYDLSGSLDPGETVRLALHWRVDDVRPDPPPQGYSFANHLLGAEGQRYGQRDGPGYRVGLWRPGDRLVSWFDITLAQEPLPGPYRLWIGMYVYVPPDQFIAVQVLDAAGQPLATGVEWPLE